MDAVLSVLSYSSNIFQHHVKSNNVAITVISFFFVFVSIKVRGRSHSCLCRLSHSSYLCTIKRKNMSCLPKDYFIRHLITACKSLHGVVLFLHTRLQSYGLLAICKYL